MYRRKTKGIIWKASVACFLLLLACSGDVLDSPLTKKEAKDKPQQELYLAEEKTVTVVIDMPSEVKVYSNSKNGFQLVGQYSNVSERKTLKFFAEKKVNDFRVSANGRILTVANGGVADFTQEE